MLDNIVLDFGNVLYEVDIYAAKYNFQKFRLAPDEAINTNNVEKIIYDYECGKFGTNDFRLKMRKEVGLNCTDDEFDTAWNSILIKPFPFAEKCVEELSKRYKLYLLSNTSPLHYELFEPQMRHIFSKFEKLYFSHKVGHRKPNGAIYEFMLKDSGIDPQRTMFVDDLPENLESFEKLGVEVTLIKDNYSLENFVAIFSV